MKNDPGFILERGTGLLDKLNSIPLINSMHSLETVLQRSRPAVAVIGIRSLKDLVNVLNITFGYHFLDADRLTYVQKPCRVRFCFSEQETTAEESAEKLCAMLAADSDCGVSLSVSVPCDTIRNCDVLLLFAPQGNVGIDWELENAQFDYALFVTNAHAALDMEERTFFENIGARLIGPSRLALALANSSFLSGGDYQQVLAFAEKFLHRTLGGDIPAVADSDDELSVFFEEEILPGLEQHHESAADQIAGLGARMIRQTIADAKKRFGVNAEDLQCAIHGLERRKDQFAKKAESICALANAFVTGSVMAPLLREAADYSERLRAAALNGAGKLTPEEAAQSVESYFHSSWEHFLNEQLPAVRDMFEEESDNIERQVRADMGELLENLDGFLPEDGGFTGGLGGSKAAPDAVFPRYDLLNGSAQHSPVKNSMLMIAAAIPLAVTNFPMALVAVATSFGLRQQEKRLARQRQAASIAQMVEEATDYYFREIQCGIEESFAVETKHLQDFVRDAYARIIDSALKSLEDLKTSLEDLKGKMQFIDAFQANMETGQDVR